MQAECVAHAAPTGSGVAVERLRRDAIGLGGVVFMALSVAAPIMAMTGNVPVAVGFGNGVGAPAGFLVATLVLLVFSVGYVAMARHITAAGAFYGYVSHGLGQVLGLACGLLATVAYIAFEPGVVGLFSAFAVAGAREQLGLEVPWIAFAALAVALYTALAYFDIAITARVLGAFMVAELALLLATSAAVLLQGGGPDGLSLAPLNPLEAFRGPAPGLGLCFALLSWIGFESTAIYGEESRDPKRVIPRATLLLVLGIGAYAVLVSWAAIVGNGLARSVAVAQADPFSLFFLPARAYLGPWAVAAYQLLIVSGAFACGLGVHAGAARSLYALGREGVLPRALGHTHPQYRSPHVASVAQAGVSALVVALFWAGGHDPYLGLYVLSSILGTLALLAVQALCSFAVIGYFRRRRPQHWRWLETGLAPLLGGLGMAAVFGLVLANAGMMAGGLADSLAFRLIPWTVPAVFLAGVVLALYLRARRPEQYALLGRIVLEDAAERPAAPESAEEPSPLLAPAPALP
jgi:amino acid transporter